MADLAHLEKMGRELKCPICLSLLKSAVSLACNHIFCNSCIKETMKSVSDCPVCKVPYHRREVRAAPHMDNLVSIYKSMEVAAGTNIFSTQLGLPTQNADGYVPGNQEKHVIDTQTGGECQMKSKRKGSSQNQKGKGKSYGRRSPHDVPIKPSFPAKKRVHVTPYPVSETPLRPEKISKLVNTEIKLTDDMEFNNNKELAINNKEDPLLSPFFWLREDHEEKSPEKSSGQQVMETPSPRNVPCFSDIKDDDDEKPAETSPTNKLNAAEDFESEMFEWTQRACSPELCSTPKKTQAMVRHRLLKIPEKECQDDRNVVVAPCTVPEEDIEVGTTGAREKILSEKRCKSGSLLKGRKSAIKRKQCVISHDINGKVQDNSGEIAERKSFKKPGRRGSKGCQKSARASQNSYPVNLNNENKTAATKASVRSPNASVQSKDLNTGTPKRTNKKKIADVLVKVSEAVSDSAIEAEAQDRSSQIKLPKFQLPSCQAKRQKCVGGILDKRGKIIQKQQLGEPNTDGGKNQASELTEGKGAAEVTAASMGSTACEYNETSLSILKEIKINLSAKNSAEKHTESSILRKCERNSLIQCAFCHSSSNTEDSGEMMHYYNGKPVAADFNGGTNVMHSHKHCVEWAPDVYFEDDIAINLTAEVSRSRRIKCSCCGVKGAALGCYEKSCRKSFHFTCAKLMPECKWDTQNFVMLCPLHSSNKLPNDSSETQKQIRKRSLKGSSQASSISKPCDHPNLMWRSSGFACKWMLCCSALSVAEKEVVSKFAKVTGASISNTWNPDVTHVIASIDQNGAYKRTLKILKGILDGKWILRVDWINACLDAKEPVEEEKYEVTVDVHGINGGPRLGRLRIMNKEPKLFSGLKFFFSGDYSPSYKGYLQDLVTAAGGAALQRKPISRDHERLLGDTSTCRTLIVFSTECQEKNNCNSDVVINRRRCEAQALADASGGTLAASAWIIDSIAACKLQPLT